MSRVFIKYHLPNLVLFFLIILLFSIKAFADDAWRPVSPEELSIKTPVVEPNADAEALFWEVRLDDKKSGKLSYNHYVRVKIFNERGRDKFSKFDLPFTKGRKIEDVAVRVIKSDGSITELNPKDIFEREIVKLKKIKILAKSFAVPSIEIGAIVEYRYKEVIKDDSLNNERLELQRDIPIQKLTYYLRPYENSTLNYTFFNSEGVSFFQDTDKFYKGTVTNVPAFKEEPQMPPDDEVRPWVLLKYNSFYSNFTWTLFGAGLTGYYKETVKPTKEITQKAKEITAGATSEEDKLKRIYEFTQKQIRNVTFDRSYTDEQREKLKLKNPTDALKNGVANSQYVDLLFAALAKAAGFDTSLVLTGNRNERFFQPTKYTNPTFIRPCCIAINVGGKTKYFNPGAPFLPYGEIVWYEETVAMIVSEGNFLWKSIPLSTPESAMAKRVGKFKLLEDGTLEGTVKVEYYGQRAIVRRQEHYQDSPEQREKELKDEIKEKMSSAEVSEVMIENFDDNSKPLTQNYKVKIPNYAQKTGKRLFLQPGFFEYGEKPLFTATNRTHPIYFDYAWADRDEIEIALPDNYDLEAADVPQSVADSSGISSQNIKIMRIKEKNLLKYERDFAFGKGENQLFQASAYQALKGLFDKFYKADSHTITLKQK